jgi:hypothetical protein
VFRILYTVFLLVLFSFPVFSQDAPVPDDLVTHCETVADIEEAKKKGAIYIEKSGYYFVQLGGTYKGPYRSLETAKKLRDHYMQEAKKRGIITTGDKYGGTYNPRLMIDPFVRIKDKNQMQFQVPGGNLVEPKTVMIHAEPLYFEEVSFGKLDLNQMGLYFAVTGKITRKDNVKFNPAALNLQVGASVISSNGKTLWQSYGPVNEEMEFKCISKLTHTTVQPEFLLLFTIGEGKVHHLLTGQETSQPKDTTSYQYHILCSAAMETGADWYPPIEEATEEEYNKMMERMTDAKMDRIKQMRSQQNQ